MIKDIIIKNRSYRRFFQNEKITEEILRDLVELARLSPSAANRQPLKFIISSADETNKKIFPCLGWAGYLKDWDGPEEGERPAGYIIVLKDKDISLNVDCDHGIAAQSILLGAVESGFGGCIIASVKKEQLASELMIPANLEIMLVLALGKPKEKIILEEVKPDGDIKYWRDNDSIHHVPKRKPADIIIKSY
jgi:nitroreductase